jgi:N,N'-diacetyllegionaminate synthase
MNKTLIIAEAGVNHNGSLEIAHKLIDTAKEAGADYVKFQTFKAEKIVSRFTEKADYQKETTSSNESQLEMVKKLELDVDAHNDLMAYCKHSGIEFLSTPFDLDSIELLHQLGLSIFKIPSGEITNYPYLKALAKFNKKVIISTGMATLGDIEGALITLTENGTDYQNITILHCNTEYPTPFEDVNLNAIQTIRQAFKLPVGYSDHTLGIEIPIAVVALGATVIEKHFTLDRNLPGPDHKASLEPSELKMMVLAIRNVEQALGSGIKQPSPSEKKNMLIARKSIVAARAIEKDEEFTEENITTKRPGNGISPMRWNEVIGLKAKKDFFFDEKIVI